MICKISHKLDTKIDLCQIQVCVNPHAAEVAVYDCCLAIGVVGCNILHIHDVTLVCPRRNLRYRAIGS